MVLNTHSGVIILIHWLSLQGVFLWFAALTQGLHAIPAKIGVVGPREPYSAGVSGPKITNVCISVIEAKCAGPESFVNIIALTEYKWGSCKNLTPPAKLIQRGSLTLFASCPAPSDSLGAPVRSTMAFLLCSNIFSITWA